MRKVALAASAIIAAIALYAASASAHASGCSGGAWTYCSKTIIGTGVCDGKDQLPILQPAWEKEPIEILAVTIGLRAITDWAWLFAGNSDDPDIMAFQMGAGSTTKRFVPGHAFTLDPAAPDNPHVDLHVNCSTTQPPQPPVPAWWRRLLFRAKQAPAPARVSAPYEAWLIVDYELLGASSKPPSH